MSYSRSVSYNNSTFNKASKKALSAFDASSELDAGAAISIAMDSRCAPRMFKEIHRAPSDSLRTPDKAIMKIDDSKLVAKKAEEFEFAVKSNKKCPDAPKKASKNTKVVDASFFAASATSVTLYK